MLQFFSIMFIKEINTSIENLANERCGFLSEPKVHQKSEVLNPKILQSQSRSELGEAFINSENDVVLELEPIKDDKEQKQSISDANTQNAFLKYLTLIIEMVKNDYIKVFIIGLVFFIISIGVAYLCYILKDKLWPLPLIISVLSIFIMTGAIMEAIKKRREKQLNF